MGNLDAVEKRLRDTVSANPGDEQAALRLGQFLAQNQRINEAEDMLESAASRHPDSITIRRVLGELYERRDDKPKLLEVADQLRQIGNLAARGIEISGGDVQGRRRSGQGGGGAAGLCQGEAGRRRGSDSAGAEPDRGQPRGGGASGAGSRQGQRPGQRRLAMDRFLDLALSRNDAEGALKLADGLRQVNPIAAAQLRSSVLLRTNRVDEAIRTMEQALQATPDRQLALGLYGLRRDNGRMDQALSGLEEWVKRNPDDVAARTVLADTYLTRQDLKQAETHYDILVQARPGDPALLNNAAWIAHELGSPQALQYARRAHAAAPAAPRDRRYAGVDSRPVGRNGGGSGAAAECGRGCSVEPGRAVPSGLRAELDRRTGTRRGRSWRSWSRSTSRSRNREAASELLGTIRR